MVAAESKLLRQRAKAENLAKSDTNSAYFHSRIKERRMQSRITSLFDENDAVITGEEEISD